jgi:phosphoribosylaminoimidazole-succinocarboxamide synthase
VVTRKLKPVPVEAIARGYLIGSGWKDYQRTGKVSGIVLPDGLRQAEKLPSRSSPRPPRRRWATTTRTSTSTRWCGWSAPSWPNACDATLRIYRFAADYAAQRGILLADTKFEFGTDADGRLYIMDEMLTPDSSRYWPADEYQVGISPPSYDKQFVRDYLETLDWGKTAPGPKLPAEVIERTRAKYAEALHKLAGISVD